MPSDLRSDPPGRAARASAPGQAYTQWPCASVAACIAGTVLPSAGVFVYPHQTFGPICRERVIDDRTQDTLARVEFGETIHSLRRSLSAWSEATDEMLRLDRDLGGEVS